MNAGFLKPVSLVAAILRAQYAPMLDRPVMTLGIADSLNIAHRWSVFPASLTKLRRLIHLQTAIPHPGIQHPAVRPGSTGGGDVEAVMLGRESSVAHTAAETEKLQRAPPQLTVHIMLVVPAESSILKPGIDQSITCPTGKPRTVDAGNTGCCLIGRISQPGGLCLSSLLRLLRLRQQSQQIILETGALDHDGSCIRILNLRRIASRQQNKHEYAQQLSDPVYHAADSITKPTAMQG